MFSHGVQRTGRIFRRQQGPGRHSGQDAEVPVARANETFTITRGFEDCIFLYPMDEWADIEEEIDELSMYDREVRNFVRLIMRWASEVSLDGQGRISIPNPLIDFAGLDDSALILGAFDHIEIWDPAQFDGYLNEQPDDYETLAESVMR
jgi:Uncharacterized protein conserved in bacteria